MRWKCLRGKDPDSNMEYFLFVYDYGGGYTAYEMHSARDNGAVEDAVENGVPLYYRYENALIKGSHTWLVNYAVEKCGERKMPHDWRKMALPCRCTVMSLHRVKQLLDRVAKSGYVDVLKDTLLEQHGKNHGFGPYVVRGWAADCYRMFGGTKLGSNKRHYSTLQVVLNEALLSMLLPSYMRVGITECAKCC